MNKMLISAVLLGMAMNSGAAIQVVNSGFGMGSGSDLAGWKTSSTNFTIVGGAGVNGQPALVWQRSEAGGHDSVYQAVTGWKPGERYIVECKLRIEDIKVSGWWGGCVGLEMFDKNGKWLRAAYLRTNKKTDDFIKLSTVSKEIPDDTARITLSIFVGGSTDSGISGKVTWDSVTVRPFEEKPVAFLRSSRYRDMAVDGKVTFGAPLKTPRELIGKTRGEFVWRDCNGSERHTSATKLTESEAVVELAVSDFQLGRSEVRFELFGGDKLLGAATNEFTRVERLPERRVWIDAKNRCIVDGKPFFPLGMYGVGVKKDTLEFYRKSPFNCLLAGGPPHTNSLDRIHAMGLKALYSFQGVQLGSKNAVKYGFDTQEKVDELHRRRAAAYRDHPGLLGWYLFDEPGEMLIPLLERSYKILRATDPNHPVWGIHHIPDEVQSRLVACDVIGMDPYPISYNNYPIRWVTDCGRKTVAAQFGRELMWNIPQNISWDWYRKDLIGKARYPTLAELKSMNWQHIAAGANGLIGYSFDSMRKSDKNFDADWQAVCEAGSEIKRLMPVLLSEPFRAVKASDEALSIRAWSHEGYVYLLACNILEKPLKANVTFADGGWRIEGTVLGTPASEINARTFQFDLPAIGYSMVRMKLGCAAFWSVGGDTVTPTAGNKNVPSELWTTKEEAAEITRQKAAARASVGYAKQWPKILGNGHSFVRWTKGEVWEKHREFFGLTPYGTRGVVMGKDFPTWMKNLSKVCVANEDVVDWRVAEWEKAGMPEYIAISENDGLVGYCRCEKCRALDADLPGERFLVNKTDRYLNFWNRLLTKMRAKRPDVKGHPFIYSILRHPPRREKIAWPENFVGSYVPSYHESLEQVEAELKAWQAAGLKYFYMRPNYLHDRTMLPFGREKFICDAHHLFRRYGSLGDHFDSCTTSAASKFEIYAAVRLCAKPETTFDEIAADWYASFGAAADCVKRYYEHVRARCDREFPKLVKRLAENGIEYLDDSHFSRNIHELHTVPELKEDLAILESFDGKGLEGAAKQKFGDLKLCAQHYVMTLETLQSKSAEDKARLIAFRAQHKTLFSQNWWTQWNKGEFWLWNDSKAKADYENTAITSWIENWEQNAPKQP